MILSCGSKLYGSQNEERGIREEKACQCFTGKKAFEKPAFNYIRLVLHGNLFSGH